MIHRLIVDAMVEDLPLSGAGIYALIVKSTGECYVGESICVEKRKSNHLNAIRRKTHDISRLNEVELDDVRIVMLEAFSKELEKSERLKLELKWMKAVNATLSNSPFGNSNASGKRTNEQKLLISETTKSAMTSDRVKDNIILANSKDETKHARRAANLGRHWFHDPISGNNHHCKPGNADPSWAKGKMLGSFKAPEASKHVKHSEKMKGRKWFHDPASGKTMICHPSERPIGWLPGRPGFNRWS